MLRVNLGPRGYDIAIDDGSGVGEFLKQRIAKRAYVFADANVAAHADTVFQSLTDQGLIARRSTVPAGEASKSLAMAATLYDRLCDMAADRQTTVIAVGGGMVGDLAGFVAATYNRGLPWIMVPTSLLAMVDSAVGGKVGVNLSQGKNLVGAFHQPAGVWIDTAMLASLPMTEYRAGLAEVVKYGIALDADFFAWLEANVDAILRRDADAVSHLVWRCCELKARIVEQDEHEQSGQRLVLNLGHTFGHAFESVSGYAIRHGEAVAMGMCCAARLAERRGMIGPEVTERCVNLLNRLGLPTSPPESKQVDAWLDAMQRDKKAVAGKLRLVLPNRIGEVVVVDDVADDEPHLILT